MNGKPTADFPPFTFIPECNNPNFYNIGTSIPRERYVFYFRCKHICYSMNAMKTHLTIY